MSAVRNEQTKLLANALDRASTAIMTVGVLAPIAASFYDLGGHSGTVWTFIVGTVSWLSAAVALHLAAGRALTGLKP